jgi:hypothetical protein
MITTGNPICGFTQKKWESTCVITLEDAENYMNYFGEIYDIHTRLIGIAPKELIKYYKKPIIDSGYKMGEQIKVFCKGVFISDEDFRTQYSGKYKGREKHGLIVINFPTKKKMRDYLEKCKSIAILEQGLRSNKTNINERELLYRLHQERKQLLVDCVVKEESRIKKGFEL